MRLLLATRNPGKVRELQALLGRLELAPVTLATHPEVGEVDETGETFAENAVLKAQAAARATALWTLAEDSGLEVAALAGAPGVRSARYAGIHGDDAANLRKLLGALQGQADRRARFVCVAVLASPEGEVVATARGLCPGLIAHEPAGANGFGYDPVFQPLGEQRTLAELDPADKDALSHRGQALRAIAPLLRHHLRVPAIRPRPAASAAAPALP